MTPYTTDQLFQKFEEIASALKRASIYYETKLYQPNGISIVASTGGEIWEIDVIADGYVAFEVFQSIGMKDESELKQKIEEIRIINQN